MDAIKPIIGEQLPEPTCRECGARRISAMSTHCPDGHEYARHATEACECCGLRDVTTSEIRAAISTLADFNPGADEFTDALETLRGCVSAKKADTDSAAYLQGYADAMGPNNDLLPRFKIACRALVRERKVYAEDVETIHDVLVLLERISEREREASIAAQVEAARRAKEEAREIQAAYNREHDRHG